MIRHCGKGSIIAIVDNDCKPDEGTTKPMERCKHVYYNHVTITSKLYLVHDRTTSKLCINYYTYMYDICHLRNLYL